MKRIYTTPLPEVNQPDEREREGSQLSELGALEGDTTFVDQIASDPSRIELTGRLQFREPYSRIVADELEELGRSSLDKLPIFRTGDRSWAGRGFYEVVELDVEPIHPNLETVYQYDLTVSKAGTRANSLRAIEATPRSIVNPFGSGDEQLVGIPTTAEEVQWVNRSQKTDRELADPIETRDSIAVDIDVYDLEDGADAVGGDRPLLAYDVPYADDAVGVRVYDTRGRSTKLSGDGERRWQIVHSTDHNTDEEIVLSNGQVRLYLDEHEGTVRYREFGGGGFTTVVSRGDKPDDARLLDIDINEIGAQRVEAQLAFDADGRLYALDISLQLGADGILFSTPSAESDSVPTVLEDWLEDAGADTETDMMPTRGLVRKSDLKK